MSLKLQQGQVWQREGEFLRIVRLDRLKVEYKSLMDPLSKDGTHHHTSKKVFCRLLKGATLLRATVAPPTDRGSDRR